jgi:hypothetical protein
MHLLLSIIAVYSVIGSTNAAPVPTTTPVKETANVSLESASALRNEC